MTSQTIDSMLAKNLYTKESEQLVRSAIEVRYMSKSVSEIEKISAHSALVAFQVEMFLSYTPFLVAITDIFSSGNYDADIKFYIKFTLLCFMLSVIILGRLLNYSRVLTALMLSLLVGYFEPFLVDFGLGNINQIQLFILAAFIWLIAKSRSFLPLCIAGFILTTGVMLKPNIIMVPVCCLLFHLINGEKKRFLALLAGTGLGGAVAILISSIYFENPGIWMLWLKLRANILTEIVHTHSLNSGNFSLANLLYHTTGKNFSAALFIVIFAAFALIVYWSRPVLQSRQEPMLDLGKNEVQRRAIETIAIVGIGCNGMFISGGYAWLHYNVLLIPLAMLALRPVTSGIISRRRFIQRLLAAFAVLLFTKAPFFYITRGTIAHPVIINISIFILFVIAYYELFCRWECIKSEDSC